MDPTLSRDTVIDGLEQLAQHGIPSASAARFLDVGSSEFLDYFERELFSETADLGGSTCRIFEGPYGSGKTHLLQLLRGLAQDRGMAVVWTDLSQTLGLTDWRMVVQHILQNIEATVGGDVYKSLPRILEAMHRFRITTGAKPKSSPSHPGFMNAMLLAATGQPGHPAGRSLLARYLQGERVPVGELRRYGISAVKDPLSARNAEHVLKTVLAGIRHLGLRGTCLLFDENEKTLAFNRSTPPRRVVVGANLLRRLIDGTVTGTFVSTIAVFAVLPGFVENCALAYPALGQRLQLVRDPDRVIGWRSPVLPVDATTSTANPTAFLEGLVNKLDDMATLYGLGSNGLKGRLQDAGNQVIGSNAGSGYKRQLVRELATLTVTELEAIEAR